MLLCICFAVFVCCVVVNVAL